jgi:hypothetical protein
MVSDAEIITAILDAYAVAFGGDDAYTASDLGAPLYARISAGLSNYHRQPARIAAEQMAQRRGWNIDQQAKAEADINEALQSCWVKAQPW